MTWRDGSWDVFKINGRAFPGKVTVKVKPERDVQKSKAAGTDGPSTKDQGYKGASLTVTVEVFKAEHADEMIEMIGELSPQAPGGIAKPHIVENPMLAAVNVTKVYVESVELSSPANGRWPVVFAMSQWFPPEAKKPTKTKGVGDGGPIGNGYVPRPQPVNVGASFT